jgi:hypothetical protein
MSGDTTIGPPPAKPRDPFLKFLGGCAIVVGGLAAIVIFVGSIATWRLLRDPAPGRPVESLRSGDEITYVCVDLKPDDKGIQALLDRFSAWNDANRRKALEKTFLKSFPLPAQRIRLADLAPLRAEFAAWPAEGSKVSDWAARGTFSTGVFRMRLMYRIFRWSFEHEGATTTESVGGVPVTVTHVRQGTWAFTTLGNRFLVAADGTRLRRILEPGGPPSPGDDLDAAHASLALPHEDAWAAVRGITLGSPPDEIRVGRALASYDVDGGDGLSFRISAVEDVGPDGAAGGFGATSRAVTELSSVFLPGVPVDEVDFTVDPRPPLPGAPLVFSGRIPHLSDRIGEWLRAEGGGGGEEMP